MVCGSGDSGSSGGGIWGGEFAQKSRYYRTYTYERSGEIFGECRGAVLSLAVPPLQLFEWFLNCTPFGLGDNLRCI